MILKYPPQHGLSDGFINFRVSVKYTNICFLLYFDTGIRYCFGKEIPLYILMVNHNMAANILFLINISA